MELIQEFFRRIYNVPELIRMGGLVGLVAVVFAETGLMIGFFLPGDSLLVTAGFTEPVDVVRVPATSHPVVFAEHKVVGPSCLVTPKG